MNLINQIIFEPEITTSLHDKYTSNRLSKTLNEIILPTIHQYFADEKSTDQHLRIEHLEIDLGTIAMSEVNSAIPELLKQELYESLNSQTIPTGETSQENRELPLLSRTHQHKPRTTTNLPRPSDNHLEALLYFLDHGRLPWWLDAQTPLFSEEQWSDESIQKLKTSLIKLLQSQNYTALNRFYINAVSTQSAFSDIIKTKTIRPNFATSNASLLPKSISENLHKFLSWLSEEPVNPRNESLTPTYDQLLKLSEHISRNRTVSLTIEQQRTPTESKQNNSPNLESNLTPKQESSFEEQGINHETEPQTNSGIVERSAEETSWNTTNEERHTEPEKSPLSSKTEDTKQPSEANPTKDLISTEQFPEEVILEPSQKESNIEPEKSTLLSSAKEAHSQIVNPSQEDPTSSLSRTEEAPKSPIRKASGKKPSIEFKDEAEESGIPIRNAGLTLLHPFIPRFFEKLNFLDENQQINPTDLPIALQSLQYLCRGDSGLAEYTLLLEKTFCAIPHKQLVDIPPLPENIKKEADSLLEAAISHWSAIGYSSPEGLRNNFIIRDGILKRNTTGWHIQVEVKSFDILLNQLPWPINMIKFPWLEQPIFVQWNS